MSKEDQWDSNRMKRIEQKLDAVMDAMWDNAICYIPRYDNNRLKRIEQKVDQILEWEEKLNLQRIKEYTQGNHPLPEPGSTVLYSTRVI